MNDRVKIHIFDDVDYEDLAAEIQIDGDCVAVINQEQGELGIEFDHAWVWSGGRKEIPLSDFKLALEQAEASLRKMKKQ